MKTPLSLMAYYAKFSDFYIYYETIFNISRYKNNSHLNLLSETTTKKAIEILGENSYWDTN